MAGGSRCNRFMTDRSDRHIDARHRLDRDRPTPTDGSDVTFAPATRAGHATAPAHLLLLIAGARCPIRYLRDLAATSGVAALALRAQRHAGTGNGQIGRTRTGRARRSRLGAQPGDMLHSYKTTLPAAPSPPQSPPC